MDFKCYISVKLIKNEFMKNNKDRLCLAEFAKIAKRGLIYE